MPMMSKIELRFVDMISSIDLKWKQWKEIGRTPSKEGSIVEFAEGDFLFAINMVVICVCWFPSAI